MRFDLDLFRELNEEYQPKPLVPNPPKYDTVSLEERSLKRTRAVAKRVSVQGKRVLEIGCGRGETSAALAKYYGCEAVGVDIKEYKEWTDAPKGVTLLKADLSGPTASDLGTFDIIYSNSVWEHLRHPFRMLQVVHSTLRPDGQFILSANLYRGPMASHRYRDVFFPWPHLLFTNEVFNEFYLSIRHPPRGKAWVNQLSIADYLRYFDLVGFEVEDITFSMRPFDEPFYARFENELGQFPRFDLQRDFLHATLRKGRAAEGYKPKRFDPTFPDLLR